MNLIKSMVYFYIIVLIIAFSQNTWAADPDQNFLKSYVGLRPGINDMRDTTVQEYVDMLKKVSLTDGSNPKVIGWSKQRNRYILKTSMIDKIVIFTFVHDLSESSKGKLSLLLPIDFGGEKIDALTFTMLIMQR